jgi:YD repeat-containing protein
MKCKQKYKVLIGAIVFLFIAIPLISAFAEVVIYTYDDANRLIKIVHEDGSVVEYSYDEVGNLISISRNIGTAPGPPVIQGIDPDVMIVGNTYDVTIIGDKLSTTSSVTTNNPNITVTNVSAAETRINATLSISINASPVQSNVIVTTPYGTESIPINLHQATLTPNAVSLCAASTSSMRVSLNPPAAVDVSAPIANRNPDIISTPSSVIVPAGGSNDFTVTALRDGTGIIDVGNAESTVYVIGSNVYVFAKRVNVSFGFVPGDTLVKSPSVSVSIGTVNSQSTAVSNTVSVGWSGVSGITVSSPVCVIFGN